MTTLTDGGAGHLRRVFQEWSHLARYKQQQEMKRRHAVRFHYFHLLQKGFRAFTQLVHERNSRLQLLHRMMSRKIQARSFYRWSEHVRQRQRQAIQFRLYWTKHVFRSWQESHRRAVRDARLVRTADHIHHISLLRRSFAGWREFCSIRHRRRVQVESSFELHQAQSKHVQISETFQRWREYARSGAAHRVILHRVRVHAQVSLTKRVLDAWVQFIGMRRWDEILYFRAAKHRALVVQKQNLSTWRQNALLSKATRLQTIAALTHWKLTMQRRAFHGWILRMRTRQAKRHHLHEALEWRHANFLRQGLVHWAQAAFVLHDQRLLRVQTQAVAAAARLWRRIARIVAHWRYVASRGRITGRVESRKEWWPTTASRHAAIEQEIQPLGMASAAVTHHRMPPRKPLELLYDADVDASSTAAFPARGLTERTKESKSIMHVGLGKYGMSVPTSPRRSHVQHVVPSDDEMENVVREMESRMRYWQDKRREWKAHKTQLDALRNHITGGGATHSSLDLLRRTLDVMEATHRDHVAAHVSSKAEIAAFAHHIDELRRRRRDVFPN
ncbi:hypothetical protein, variant [Aphanomyces astaci]|uniref:Sfi1 spindle body domain-containing protein n=1 Tax=Aphanomyces astaci TaxID=112090 RepID=W4H268_APHAT|nr:hypothetical protein, variant [Aphanomyces astaci]ETV85992.1 hypothetical protein, variant [Aphanomyces astaci]|eukprot:XP_009824464.1 hypothetical protein, variant [Aphanomyces astaci]